MNKISKALHPKVQQSNNLGKAKVVDLRRQISNHHININYQYYQVTYFIRAASSLFNIVPLHPTPRRPTPTLSTTIRTSIIPEVITCLEGITTDVPCRSGR